MKMRLPGLLKIAGLAAIMLSGGFALLPGQVGAQTAPMNANLVAATSGSSGTGLVTLSGYNNVAVTLNSAAVGGAYNVFSCSSTISTPTSPTCQLDGAVYANSGGQATGNVPSTIPTTAITEVFVQNSGNPNEMYVAVFSGTYASTSGCTTGIGYPYYYYGATSCTSGYACNYLNVYNGQPICLPIGGGGAYLPYFSFGTTFANTTCIPGGGLQPVVVNGQITYQFC